MQVVERAVELHFRRVARARERHGPVADDARGGPGRHDDDAIRQRDRLFEIVGDEHHRLAVGAPQIEQQIAHDLARLRVKRAERLVHQQNLRIADQHLHQPDALPLPAREHVRITVAEAAQADARQPLHGALARLRLGGAGGLEPDRDILERGLPREQRFGLEQVAGLPVQPAQRRAEDIDRARRGREQSGGGVEKGRLAAASRADDRDEFAIRDAERGAFDGRVGAAVGQAERYGDVAELDCRCPRHTCDTLLHANLSPPVSCRALAPGH